MPPEQQERTNQELQKLMLFQNLVPGTQHSPFIDRFKDDCLDTEEDDELKKTRDELLNLYPPVLSFKTNKQKKDFYDKEAENCSQFCCGGISIMGLPQLSSTGKSSKSTSPTDNYEFSIGTGALYEGSASEITSQLGQDASAERFGSAKQEQQITGMKEFSAIVSQRIPEALPEGPARQAPNPFKIKPDPL